jgi:phosphoribosylaminoimidazolecarboxamide formyltransferase/IMP cyclohydrolase
VLRGKELSYNNLLDLDGAWRAATGFATAGAGHASAEGAAVAVVKHSSPCGLACADEASQAVRAAIDCDPVSAFGGIIATNRPVDENFVKQLGDIFLECLAAPDFSDGALRALSSRKNLRLLQMHPGAPETGEYRSIQGGMLWQERDHGQIDEKIWKVVTRRAPSDAELESLRFAWIACQHVRSNAIVLAQGLATVGIGGGQPNRVDSVRIALQRAGERSKGAVLASDAFFPFADSLQVAAEAGITAVIQPGGSVRDQESIDFADQQGLAMIFTGRRHFRH